MSVLYITEQGGYLRLKAGRFAVCKADQELASVPEAAVDSVVVFGHVQVSTQAVHELLENGIPLVYLSRNGRFKGILQPGYSRNIHVRLSQYDAVLRPGYVLSAAREIAAAKLLTQEITIRKWLRNRWLEASDTAEKIAELQQSLDARTSLQEIRGVEAAASVAHFSALAETLPPPFTWHGRNRQPPRDPVNGLLSLAYMLAMSEAVTACYVCGLDPFMGFLHQLDYGRPSLALDLLEPLRAPCCDHFVMRLLQSEAFCQEDFDHSPTDGCRLTHDALVRFIGRYEDARSGTSNRRLALKPTLDRLTRTTIYPLLAGSRDKQTILGTGSMVRFPVAYIV